MSCSTRWPGSPGPSPERPHVRPPTCAAPPARSSRTTCPPSSGRRRGRRAASWRTFAGWSSDQESRPRRAAELHPLALDLAHEYALEPQVGHLLGAGQVKEVEVALPPV